MLTGSTSTGFDPGDLQTAASPLSFGSNLDVRLAYENPELSKLWVDVLGGKETYARRAISLGIDPHDERAALSCDVVEGSVSQSPWSETFFKLLAQTPATSISSSDFTGDLPMGIAIGPVFEIVDQVLDQEITNKEILTDEALSDLKKSLASKLHNTAMRMLLEGFDDERPDGLALSWALFGPSADIGDERLSQYLSGLRDGGLSQKLRQFPVLARLFATVIDDWVEMIGELCTRATQDQTVIAQAFQRDTAGRIRRCVFDLSDAHNGGRTVCHIEFECGLQVAYKPRSVDMEASFFELLGWCNTHLEILPFKKLVVIDRQDYGWVEWLEHTPSHSETELSDLFFRSGMLLAIIHLLGGTDGHSENFIASGEHLCLIDAETLLHPTTISTVNDSASSLVGQQLARSVAGTGMLPMPIPNKIRGPRLDLSAFGAAEAAANGDLVEITQWDAVGTDAVHVARKLQAAAVPLSAAVFRDAAVSPSEFETAIVDGFRNMYEALGTRLDTLLNGPLSSFKRNAVRVVVRPTSIYQMTLDRSIETDCLKDGVTRSIVLDALAAPLLNRVQLKGTLPILKSECRALEKLDIPYFSAFADSADLIQAPDAKFITRSGWQLLNDRVENWCAQDMEDQISLIQTSIAFSTRKDAQTAAIVTSTSPASNDELTAAACEIGNQVMQSAVKGDDGSVAWLSLAYDAALNSFVIRPTSDDLYDGRAGIGLFLASCAKVTNNSEFREMALACMTSITKANVDDATPIGGAMGIGSRIYGLATVSKLLQNETLLVQALELSELLTEDSFELDDQNDVMFGTAGALLGLSTLYRSVGDPAVLKRIRVGVDQLLEREEGGSWRSIDGVPQTGFSHGASGIALALHRAAKDLDDDRAWQSRNRAISWEQSHFCKDNQNWRDLRQANETSFMNTWCHGATGIGLTRLQMMDQISATTDLEKDAASAVQSCRDTGLVANDHLCCGNAGKFQFLFEAGRRLNNENLNLEARRWARSVMSSATKSGGFAMLNRRPAPQHCWDLFHGVSGIGQSFLRMAYPEIIPQPLHWGA